MDWSNYNWSWNFFNWEGIQMINLFAVFLTAIATFIGAFGAILLKKGSKNKSMINMKVFWGLFLYGLSTILYIIALKREQLSILYPIVSLNYVWVSVLSVSILKEKMNFWKWFGIAVIMFGVIVIGFGS